MMISETDDQEANECRILFSRAPTADAFGKLLGVIAEFRVDPDTALAAQKEANRTGVSVAEICRTALRVRLYGKEHVETVIRNHHSRVIGNVGETSEPVGAGRFEVLNGGAR